MQVSLAAVLKIRALQPKAMIVHSHHEIAASVVSGTRQALKELSAEWTQKGVQVLTVQSDTAFRSPMLLALVEPL